MFRVLLFLLFSFLTTNLFAQDTYWCSKCNTYHTILKSNIESREIVITLSDGTLRNIRDLPQTWPTWSWPGNLEQHLIRTHNVNTQGWSHAERVNLHNYAHNTAKNEARKNFTISCNVRY